MLSTRLFHFAPDGFFDPFPYYDIIDENGNNIGIAYKTYWHYIGQYLQATFFWLFLWTQRQWAYEGRWLFWLWVAAIADYCIRYGQEFINVFGWGVNFSDLRLTIVFAVIVRRILIEKRQWNSKTSSL